MPTLKSSSLSIFGNICEAARTGNLEAVKAILKNDPTKANARADDGGPRFVFRRIADSGKGGSEKEEVVDLRLAQNAHLAGNATIDRSVLGYAAAAGYPEIVALLLSHGADPNSNNENGEKPLHIAIASGRGAGSIGTIVDLLIKSGAEVNAIRESPDSSFYLTPLDMALSECQKEAAHLLVRNGAKTHIIVTFALASEGGAKKLLSIDPSLIRYRRHCDGWTLLHGAAALGNLTVVKLLVNSGVDARDLSGRRARDPTPLHLAAQGNHCAVAEFLLYSGADVESAYSTHSIANEDGRASVWTPLQDAASHGQTEVAKILLENGASVYRTDQFGATALHWASGCNEIATLLLEKAAEVNAKDRWGETPLDWGNKG